MACFHFKSCASIGYKLGLLPTRLVTEVPCGLAHHVGKVTRFHFRSCVSYTIASHTGFNFSCWKHNVMNVTVVGVQMDHSCSRVLKILFDFSVFLYSCFNFLLLLNTSIEGKEKKTALEQICK